MSRITGLDPAKATGKTKELLDRVNNKMFGSPRSRILFLIAVAANLVVQDVECATVPEPGDLRGVGKVMFPVTCAPDVQSDFARY